MLFVELALLFCVRNWISRFRKINVKLKMQSSAQITKVFPFEFPFTRISTILWLCKNLFPRYYHVLWHSKQSYLASFYFVMFVFAMQFIKERKCYQIVNVWSLHLQLSVLKGGILTYSIHAHVYVHSMNNTIINSDKKNMVSFTKLYNRHPTCM